jgi:hypothetical protein
MANIRQFHIDKLFDAIVFNDFDAAKRLIDNHIYIFDGSKSIDGEPDAVHIALYNHNNAMLNHLIDCQLSMTGGQDFINYYIEKIVHFQKADNYIEQICYHDNVEGLDILFKRLSFYEVFKQYHIDKLVDKALIYHSGKVLNYINEHELTTELNTEKYYRELHEIFRQDLSLEGITRGKQIEQTGVFLHNFEQINPSFFQATLLMVLVDSYFTKEIYQSKNLYALNVLKQYFETVIDINSLNYQHIYDKLKQLKPELKEKGHKTVLMYVNRTLKSLEQNPQDLNLSFDKLFTDSDMSNAVKEIMDNVLIEKEKTRLENQLGNSENQHRKMKI